MFKQIIILIGLIPVLCSCGNEEAPDLPRSENKLVIELFEKLDEGEHSAALRKVERLRHINSDNVFLARLENIEQSNSLIEQIEKKLEVGNIESAENMINTALMKNRDLLALAKLKKDLVQIKRISRLIEELDKKMTVTEAEKVMSKLKDALGSQLEKPEISQFVSEKQNAIDEIKRKDTIALLFDLSLDIDAAVLNNSEFETDLAQLAVEVPDSFLVKHYVESLQRGAKPTPYLMTSDLLSY